MGGVCLFSFTFFFFIFKFSDLEYKRFLEAYSVEEEKTSTNPETLLGDIEAKSRELFGLFCSSVFYFLEPCCYRVCFNFFFSRLSLKIDFYDRIGRNVDISFKTRVAR